MQENVLNVHEAALRNAKTIFPILLEKINHVINENPYNKVVVSISGGSGTGKTSIAYVLSHLFKQMDIESYVLSGDNYPHRIPKYNDAERLRIFRECGILRMIDDGVYNIEASKLLQELQEKDEDSNESLLDDSSYSWLKSYIEGGKDGLRNYLGTENEQNFKLVSDLLASFHNGAQNIWIRHMGREESEIFYENKDFSHISVLIVEWTHGNSEFLKGVDLSVFLQGSPQETLKRRLERNRDNGIDKPFTAIVLGLEQEKLDRQEKTADIVVLC